MSYFVVSDFRGGLNTSRLAVTAAPGTLRALTDAHINRGGEIEKRLAWVPTYTLPAGTLGLAALGGVLYVFGTPVAPPMPVGVAYQQIDPGGGAAVTSINDVEGFAGKLYVSANTTTGAIRHFYDGVRVTNFAGQTDAEGGRVLMTHNQNMYAAADAVLHRCSTDDPNNWDTLAPGAAFFDMSTQAAGSEVITGLAEYDADVAVFSRRTVQFWSFAADPVESSKGFTLRNTGCVSPRTVLAFAGDVFYLADNGMRSLRARAQSDSPSTQDVGTAIDDLVSGRVRGMTAAEMAAAHAVLEPTGGRYILVLGTECYVFSYFPGGKVSAWSTYTLPGEPVNTVAMDGRVYMRVGDTIYVLGGLDGATYDSTSVEAELPYLDGRQIATWKRWTGIDIAAEGTWEVYASYDPSLPDTEDLIATLTGSTFHYLNIPMLGIGPMVKLRLVSTGTGPAKLGSLVVHYEKDSAG